MLIDQPIPNLFGGVSQQPPQARFLNQLEAEENCLADPVEGLDKRPPLEHVGNLSGLNGAGNDVAVIPIERDKDNRYMAVIQDGIVRVYGIDGTAKAVNNPVQAYLNTSTPRTSIKALTVADYTFLLNTDVTAAKKSDTSPAVNNEGFVWVRAGNYGRTYTIKVKEKDSGTTVFTSSYTTPDGDQPSHADQIDTSYIATQLDTAFAGWVISNEGSIITIRRNVSTDFVIEVEDGQGGEAMKAYKGTVQRFSDLPSKALNGLVLEVVGDNSSAFDNYWVTYQDGTWTETLKPESETTLDEATMPLGLVRNPDDSFDVVTLPWLARSIGDDDSNPFPSFVGQKLNGLLYFRNRLGFIADENLILSATGDYFNFFRTTVTQLLDSDPIDVAVQDVSGEGSSVSILRHAVAFDKRLLLFADKAQFVVDSDGGALTPLTIKVDPVTSFAASAVCRPGTAGRYVYFPFDRDGASGVRELSVDGVTQTEDALEITAHVPTYLPAGLTSIIGTTLENIMLYLQAGSRYAYKYEYFWNGDEKAQSSFGRWDFGLGSEIEGGAFFDNSGYFVVKRESVFNLERIRLRPGLTDSNLDYFTKLDRRVDKADMTVNYSAITDKTTITFPYEHSGSLEVRTVYSPSQLHAPGVSIGTKVSNQAVEVDGDVSAWDFVGGVPYENSFTMTKPYLTSTQSGTNRVANTRAEIRVKDFQFDYVGTGYFVAEFTPTGRATFSKTFSGDILGATPTDIPSLNDGDFRIKTPCKNTYHNLTIKNDSPFPSRFIAASWRGLVESKSRRV